MTTTKSTPGRRGRPRKVESYADWMARIDASVDTMARTMERKPPTFAYLHPAQRKIVQMLIEHLRSLPELEQGKGCFDRAEYGPVNRILKELFAAKYPAWALEPRLSAGNWDVYKIPNGEGREYEWMLRNCAGRAPIEELKAVASGDDDD